MDVITESERLILRRYVRDDLDDVFRLLSDPEVMRFSLGVKSRDQCVAWIQRCLTHYATHGWGLWAVIHRGDGCHIGCCGILPQVIDDREEAEVAYRLLPAYWGRGLGTEAATAVRRHAWEHLGLDRLISIIEPGNRASIRVAEKHGMRLEKETVAWERRVRIYSICRADAAPQA